MTLDLVFSKKSTGMTRAPTYPLILVQDLDHDYKIYLFYYKAAFNVNNLENRLHSLKATKSKDLLVRVLDSSDYLYEKMRPYFKLNSLPVIIITGNNELASLDYGYYCKTACVKIEGKNLFKSEDLAVQIIKELVDLFKEKKFYKLLEKIKDDYGEEQETIFRDLILHALKEKVKALPENEFAIYLIEGQFKLGQSFLET